MIFVTVGTTQYPFDRLMTAVERLPVEDELVVQCGASTVVPTRGTVVETMPYDELIDTVRSARTVISHAGVGSIMVALGCGKRPLVVPRRACHGEHIDDHQLQIAKALERRGQIIVVPDPEDLVSRPELLDQGQAAGTGLERGPLVDEIARYVVELSKGSVPAPTGRSARAPGAQP